MVTSRHLSIRCAEAPSVSACLRTAHDLRARRLRRPPAQGLRAWVTSPRGWCSWAWGLLCSLGALVYATRRPNPSPRVFGYHEVFHLMVIAASVCHFIVVTSAVQAIR